MSQLVHPEARLVDAATGGFLVGPSLRAAVDTAAGAYAGAPPGLVLTLLPNRLDAVVGYLGALAADRPVALLDPAAPHVPDLVHRFAPAIVTGVSTSAPPGYRAARLGPLGPVWVRADARVDGPPPPPPHPDLALLLATSGSTGNPRLVRLSRTAVLANAHAIAAALGIRGGDVAATSLPLHYTYGLSVLHSHLVNGATVVVTDATVMQREFWRDAARFGVTSLAAVPYQYEMLRRLHFNPEDHPRLRTLTQAGGRLRNELVADFHGRMAAVGGRLFVMYGQTEATARMTVLPSGALPDKLGSVGLAVPGGSVSIAGDGEILFHGPNVMMGYADTARDLARGDDLGGWLATGDLGHLDGDGFLYVDGRKRRIAKIFGVRVNLDDVERMLTGHGALAAVGGDDRVRLWIEGADEPARDALRAEAARRLGTHSSGIEVRAVDRLPLLANGKVDYRALDGVA
ncbi:AMP-binding protein [Luedemannella helvata]|uniref:AMP-binding protein n=1 Tax=Luedemannella helvata TaxID=349315 RepID=A0ABP4WVK9_9ACTN